MYTYVTTTGGGGWQTSTTGVDVSQWQGTTSYTGQVIPVVRPDYYYHPYTIDFDMGSGWSVNGMIESVNEVLKEKPNPKPITREEPQPFNDEELNSLLFDEG